MPQVAESGTEKNFKLDSFQEEAINHIQSGKSVIVCAPTGTGKTLIAEQALQLALANKKKAFYTTPLKALSNQKYQDFCNKFGEENVGLITGDTSKNREAPIVIMTTEVYRNMLYGTNFGSLDPYLDSLQYVILDECHYMNDENRGTVWEESIIYSPKQIQVIGLSATINNPNELVDWIKEIHGDCELVETNHRPVPLHNFYFKENQLLPLLTTNFKLNPKLKERNDARFGRGKGNKFKRGATYSNEKAPTASDVVQELYNKELLPAIYFVFSRKGCDSSAKECAELKLLTDKESKELNSLIDEAVKGNSHLEKHPQLELLRKGIASHHAGLLPQWKALVEDLFNRALVKVVFSTETLAAGINMPARSTIISTISKRSDDGHRNLKASEFLQMSGRAGRRGIDDKGYVVTIKSRYETAGEVSNLATAKPEDLASHFTSSYEMVLNLLQNHSLEDTKDLISKSFGQAQANKNLNPLKGEASKLEDKVIDLQHPLCPGELGDLNHYREMQDKLDQTRAKKKKLEKAMSPEVVELEELLQISTLEAQNYPCNGCPKQKPCSKQMSQIKRYKKRIKELNAEVASHKNIYWGGFQKIVNLLKDNDYLTDDHKLTTLGKTCASIRSENSFLITEILKHKEIFIGLTPEEFAATASALTLEEARSTRDSIFVHPTTKVYDALQELHSITRQVIQSQRKHKIEKSVELGSHIAPLVQEWCKSDMDWDGLMKLTNKDDGDIIRGLRRTTDVIKQIVRAPGVDEAIVALAKEAIPLIEKAPVLEETQN